MSTEDKINSSDIEKCEWCYIYEKSIHTELGYYWTVGTLYITVLYKPLIMKPFDSITITDSDIARKYIYTIYNENIPSGKDMVVDKIGNMYSVITYDSCEYKLVTHQFREVLIENKTNEILHFLQDEQEKKTYVNTPYSKFSRCL